MIGNAPRSIYTGVPGWETEAEQALLAELAAAVPAKGTIYEIGGEFGMSASIFAKFAPEGARIITIDLFPDKLLEQHRANLAEAGLEGRSEQIAADSKDITLEKGTAIDLLFVDGDHSYEGVKSDIARFVPSVPVGGVVVFHDCACMTNHLPHELHFEVTRAVSEWFWLTKGKWELVKTVDSTMVFKRLK